MIEGFVQEGYVHLPGVFSRSGALNLADDILARVSKDDIHEEAVRIMESYVQNLGFFHSMQMTVLPVMKSFLGPDVCLLGYDALWINKPKDRNPVLLKGIHNDAWTGTSVNTIFCKFFLTDCDKWNGITMYKGSHLQGMMPVRNRSVAVKVRFPKDNIIAKAGDALIWHPLTLHSTTGHSNRRTRVSITSRYSSSETPFSSQERALGYRTLSVGPLNKILRLIGNDYLTPLRTYGGTVAIDKRMKYIYK